MAQNRNRTEFAPRKVENSVSREKFEAYMAAREKALADEAEAEAEAEADKQ